jgi:arabinan endo-1,5-alpha-L-arabinosidase
LGAGDDRDGKDLLRGGGTVFMDSEGKLIGPGHAGVYSNGPTNWLTFHYYDGTRHGAATLALRALS